MSFYQFSLFVILFGPWVTAREVYFNIRKNSVDEAREKQAQEERRQKLIEDTPFPIINNLAKLASHTRTWAQWLRRLLKSMRKWCNSHPPEVKLGKCFASYFNIKIPGLRRNEKIYGYNDNQKESLKFETIPRPLKREADVDHSSQKITAKVFPSLRKNVFTFLQDVFIKIIKQYQRYYEAVFKNQLLTCFWDYFVKKFWTWVDSAPDSRLHL